MKMRQIQVIFFSALILFEGVAAAASISTRVRVLESKVSKHDRAVKEFSLSQSEQQQRIDQGMNRIHLLERKVKTLDKQLKKEKEAKRPKNSERADKRYAYP